jgi:hypothetical protein
MREVEVVEPCKLEVQMKKTVFFLRHLASNEIVPLVE